MVCKCYARTITAQQLRMLFVAEDTTAPQFDPYLSEKVFEAVGATTTVEFATPTATDNLDGAVTVECNQPSPLSVTGLVNTTVTCTARDTSGNQASLSFNVAVGE